MKTRISFVANSSSSSFIAIGIQSDELAERFFDFDEDDCEWTKKKNVKLPKDIECFARGEGEAFIGKILKEFDDEGGYLELEADFEELINYSKLFEEAIGVKPKLIGLTYGC